MVSKQRRMGTLTFTLMKPMATRPSSARLGQIGDTDLRLLKVFKSVADCGGMSAAELELNVGTSTISRHVKDLETRLGLTLCRRGRAGFALTPEGQRIYEETARLLGAFETFRGGVDDIHRRMGGTLEIGIFDKTATNPSSRIASAIADFTDRAPGVVLQLQVTTINNIERKVIDGSLHIGIIPAHRSSEALEYHALFAERMLLYCGCDHPLFKSKHAHLDWKALRKYKFAGLGYHSPNMEASHRAGLRRAASGLDQEAIALLILTGRFLGFLPDHYAEGFERKGQIRAVRPEVFKYECDFVCVTRRSPSPARAAETFRDCLVRAHQR